MDRSFRFISFLSKQAPFEFQATMGIDRCLNWGGLAPANDSVEKQQLRDLDPKLYVASTLQITFSDGLFPLVRPRTHEVKKIMRDSGAF